MQQGSSAPLGRLAAPRGGNATGGGERRPATPPLAPPLAPRQGRRTIQRNVPIRIRFPDQADSSCPRSIAVEACDGPCNIVDLGPTTFAKPFGITLLYGLIYQFRHQGESVRVLIPNSSVSRYLWRMNVHKPFENDTGVGFEPNLGLFPFTRWLQPRQLLGLSAVDVTSDDEVVGVEE